MKTRFFAGVMVVFGTLMIVSPARAQLGGIGKALGRANEIRQDFVFTESEERQLGSDISTKLRDRYGVVQDRAVHQYVSLVGTVLGQASSRPQLTWTFVVLDTDGVNAFAAPGGFIHITRGALALIQSEAELAAVLGHEIAHVTAKHTLEAIKKSNLTSTAAQMSRSAFLSAVAERGYAVVLENSFDRGDETESDRVGITLANTAGYAPQGLGSFLTRLAERNKGLTDRSGMFASHPEARARQDALAKTIASGKLTATAQVAARYGQSVVFKPTPVTNIGQGAAAPAAAPAASTSKPASGGFLGLGNRSAQGRDRSSNETVSSAGSRGVNPDRDAPGGPNKALVPVTVSAAQIAEFRKGITG
jgi:beta-barrel assembly-enhancing protease